MLVLSQCQDNGAMRGSTFLHWSKTTNVSMISSMKEITENQPINLGRGLKRNFQHLLSVTDSSISLVHFTLRTFLEHEAYGDPQATFKFPQIKHPPQFGLSDTLLPSRSIFTLDDNANPNLYQDPISVTRTNKDYQHSCICCRCYQCFRVTCSDSHRH